MRKHFLFESIAFLAFLLLLTSCGNNNSDQQLNTTTNKTIDAATGCSLEYLPICGKDGLTYQNTCFSSLRDVGVEHIGVCEYNACSFNGQVHYMMNNMIYYEDDKERPYVEVLYGTFRTQADGDGWTYVRTINKGSSYYTNRMMEYDAGVTESGNAVTCNTVTELPEQLKEFLKTHGKILLLKIEGYQELTENSTNSSTVTE